MPHTLPFVTLFRSDDFTPSGTHASYNQHDQLGGTHRDHLQLASPKRRFYPEHCQIAPIQTAPAMLLQRPKPGSDRRRHQGSPGNAGNSCRSFFMNAATISGRQAGMLMPH